MPITHILRVSAYFAQSGRNDLTPAQRRRVRRKLNRARRLRGI